MNELRRKIIEFYKSKLGFEPYNYQLKVSELILSNKNVILSVPTGSGKTWASIVPFLISQNDSKFPQKLIYSLPLRTLANSIYNDVDRVLANIYEGNKRTTISIQTGDFKEDEDFESDIMFSTIDQTLSSFLCFPLSKSKRQANINAGALIGSYLVFDEFHLLDPKLSMATTLGSLKILAKASRFCIMTATLSADFIHKLKETINAEVVLIDDYPEVVLKINSLKIPDGLNCKKKIEAINEVLTANKVKQKHKNKSIVICNRVDKAQEIFTDLINDKELSGTKIICLHSRFYDLERKEKEKELKRIFGKNSKINSILVSTQVIEAGMDISCDIMHLEISPINSLLQRAGRCARWENEYGEVFTYQIVSSEERCVLTEKEIKNKYLPYNYKLSELTFKEVAEISYIDKDISQQLVDKILGEKEQQNYKAIYESRGGFNRELIKNSWSDCSKSNYSSTIRDINNLDIVVFDYSKYERESFNPYKQEVISMYRFSLIKWIKQILEDCDLEDELIFKIEEDTIVENFSNEGGNYKLKKISDYSALNNYYDIIFIDKSVLDYSRDIGLRLGKGFQTSPLKQNQSIRKENHVYKKDTYSQHCKAIYKCYLKEFESKCNYPFERLNELWEEEIDWDRLIKLMIYFHDYGKLNKNWQIPMRALQELKNRKDSNFLYDRYEVLAHSDFDSENDLDIEKLSKTKLKPPHAGVGAYAFSLIGEEILDYDCGEELSKCVITAILKHHGVDTESFPDFEIADNEYEEMSKLLKEIPLDIPLVKAESSEKLSDYIADVYEDKEWLTYLFLVRILRLCDQKATKDISKYLNT